MTASISVSMSQENSYLRIGTFRWRPGSPFVQKKLEESKDVVQVKRRLFYCDLSAMIPRTCLRTGSSSPAPHSPPTPLFSPDLHMEMQRSLLEDSPMVAVRRNERRVSGPMMVGAALCAVVCGVGLVGATMGFMPCGNRPFLPNESYKGD